MWCPILTFWVISVFAVCASACPRHKRTALIPCLEAKGVSMVAPGSSNFGHYSQAFNKRLQYTPAAIVFPKSAHDVSAAVKCARKSNTSVAARSGGHNYAAFGLGGQDGALVVDLSKMKKITVNSDETATIQTGNRLGDVALTLFNNGRRAMPHGTCPYVGIGGHAGCGGFGRASRMWGLVLDQTLSAEVVISNGTILTASSTENPDLFWALRGAAPSFGIVTEYKVKTYNAPSSNIMFTYSYRVDPAKATTIFLAFQAFGQSSAPPNLGMEAWIEKNEKKNQIHINLSGIFYGSRTDFDKIIKSLLDKVPKPRSTSVEQYEWIPALEQLAGGNPLDTSKRPDRPDRFFAKSLMVPGDALLKPEAIRSLFDYLANQGASSSTWWFVQAGLFGGKGSKISGVPLNATAYAHRGGLYDFQMYASSGDSNFPSDGLDFVNKMHKSITSKMPSDWQYGSYPCYPDPTLSADEWKKRYYGVHYPRLVSIHEKYNPSSIFRYQQAIGS